MMMNRLTLILLGCLLAWPAIAEDVDRRLDAAPDGYVHVSNTSGSVSIRGWSRDEVEVSGTLGRNVEELVFERNGNKVTIKVKLPKGSSRSSDADLRISVPEMSSIDIGTISADIDVADVKGFQSLHTVSGDITSESAGGDVTAEAVSGDIDIVGGGQDSQFQANSVSGDVSFFRASGTLEAETVTGDLVADEGSFDRADLNSVNGEILFLSELRKGGRLTIETVNGEVGVEFSNEVSARFDIESFNGDIDNCFGPEAVRTSRYSPGTELSFQQGSGDGRVTISTMNGDISVCMD
jgi:DUF4097 and DUF4098 domain-containing protein YvlB